MARFKIRRKDLYEAIKMNRSSLSQYLSESKQLPGWAAHNIGMGINILTGLRLLDVDDTKGLLDPPPAGRPPKWNVPDQMDPMRRPQKPRKRRWRGQRFTPKTAAV
jgi:hypothetical protein